MTRRKFIQRFIKAGAVIITGVGWLAKKSPRKFVRAVRLKKYPGPLRALRNIRKQSKWSG